MPKPNRLSFATALVVISLCSNAFAAPFTLISAEEYAADQAYIGQAKGVASAAVTGAPEIDLLQPIIEGGTVVAPVNIELAFRTSDGSSWSRDSLQVYYGRWKLNITDRLLKEASDTEHGLLVEDADIPTGKHKITVVLADSAGRTRTRVFKFKIK